MTMEEVRTDGGKPDSFERIQGYYPVSTILCSYFY